jgi:hypothetical protein
MACRYHVYVVLIMFPFMNLSGDRLSHPVPGTHLPVHCDVDRGWRDGAELEDLNILLDWSRSSCTADIPCLRQLGHLP